MVWAAMYCCDDCDQLILRRHNYDTTRKVRGQKYSRTIDRIWVQNLRTAEQKKYNRVAFSRTKITRSGCSRMERRYEIFC